jgi:broad specificity phosphatase PhoE
VTDVVRLTMVSHAMTDAMAAGRFPADEPLNDIGRRQVKRLATQRDSRHLTGPERRAGQTAELLGLRATTEPALADLNCAAWRGLTPAAVNQGDLQTWLTDAGRAPHGGESIVGLTHRVAGWLEALGDNALPTVAVTHPAVVRAAILLALDAPASSFWRIDIAPASHVVMHLRNGRWTLRL